WHLENQILRFARRRCGVKLEHNVRFRITENVVQVVSRTASRLDCCMAEPFAERLSPSAIRRCKQFTAFDCHRFPGNVAGNKLNVEVSASEGRGGVESGG